MPLQTGHSPAVISANIGELIKAGHPKAQAAAIAYRKAGEGAKDMAPEDWDGLLSGLIKFYSEEIEEPEHAEDAASPTEIEKEYKQLKQASREYLERQVAGRLDPSHLKSESKATLVSQILEDKFGRKAIAAWSSASTSERNRAQDAMGGKSSVRVGWVNVGDYVSSSSSGPPMKVVSIENWQWPKSGRDVKLENGSVLHIAMSGSLTRWDQPAQDARGDTLEANCRKRGGAPFRKTFKDHASLEKYIDQNPDVIVEATREIEGSAQDSMALDRSSLRSYDHDGRMHVETSNISKAAVNPYIGHEIPGYEELGLQADKKYMLLRDPDELKKAVDSFNNLPILSQHVPVTANDADSHKPEFVIGSTGTDANFEAPFLSNSLVLWAKPAIDDVESNQKKELSSAYRYRADMTPGTHEGVHYDGVMRDIIGNHVALVKAGRAGGDVVVGDSNEEILKMPKTSKTTMSRKEALVRGALFGYLLPKLATDEKIDSLKPVITGITVANFKDRKKPLLEAMGKLKLATDEDLNDAPAVMDALERQEPTEDAADPATAPNSAVPPKKEGEDEEPDEEEKKRTARDAAINNFMKGKLNAGDQKAFDAIMGPPKVPAEDEVKNPQPDLVTKSAMDEAIATEVGKATKLATEQATKIQKEIRDAERTVRPYVGDLAMAHDSAEAVYRTALTTMGVKIEGIHASALPAILAMQPLPGAKRPAAMAQDAQPKDFATRYPGAGNIRVL